MTEISPRRLTYSARETAILETCVLPEPGKKDVLVQTLYSGISKGTESLVYKGLVPESEHQAMRCPHQQGGFSYPLTYGYACTGKVIATGTDVKSVSVGQNVFVLHPHQDYFIVSEDWVSPLPKSVPARRGVLSANMETALNAIWDAELSGEEQILVIGAGVVGLLTAYLCAKHTDRPPLIVDIKPNKQPKAEALGLEFKTPADLGSNAHEEFTRIFHTSASEEGLRLAIANAAFEARIIEMSWYGSRTINLELGGAFHSKRLQIISSQVGHVSPAKRKAVSHTLRLQMAIKHLEDERLDRLLHPEIRFSELADALSGIFDPASDALCPLVNYKSE